MRVENNGTATVMAASRLGWSQSQRVSLCEVLDRVLNKGVVVDGEATISVAGIDLIYLGLKVVLTSIEAARSGRCGARVDRGTQFGRRKERANATL